MPTSPHLGLTYLESAQAQKEITANEAFARLEALLNTGVLDRDVSTPPSTPAAGDVYIVATGATGAWAGKDGQIAYFDRIWRFILPRQGVRVWVVDEQALCYYDGSAWQSLLPRVARHTLALDAMSLRPSSSSGCAAAATLAMGSGQPDIITLNFDPTTIEYAECMIAMPKGWDEGTINVQFLWSHASTSTSFGVVWSAQAVACSDADSMAVAYGTAVSVTDTGGSTNTLYQSSETAAITIAATPSTQDVVFLRVFRNATHGSDTLTIDARLHGVRVFFSRNSMTDA